MRQSFHRIESVRKELRVPLDRFAQPDDIAKVMEFLVTDLSATDSEELLAEVRAFLGAVDGSGTEWSVLPGAAFDNVQALLEGVEARQPDLIVT